MNNNTYIENRNKKLRGNIHLYSIGQILVDKDKSRCIITDKTSSSIEVYIQKKTKEGINCKSWFSIDEFEKRFNIFRNELKANAFYLIKHYLEIFSHDTLNEFQTQQLNEIKSIIEKYKNDFLLQSDFVEFYIELQFIDHWTYSKDGWKASYNKNKKGILEPFLTVINQGILNETNVKNITLENSPKISKINTEPTEKTTTETPVKTKPKITTQNTQYGFDLNKYGLKIRN